MDIHTADRLELERLVGEGCAGHITGLCMSLDDAFADPRTEAAINSRPRSAVCADLAKVAKAAKTLRGLLMQPDVALLLEPCLDYGFAPMFPSRRHLPVVHDAERMVYEDARVPFKLRQLEGITLEMGELREAAELAAKAYAPRRGPAFDPRGQMVLRGLVSCFSTYALPIGTGDDSTFVKAARWVWERLDIGSDGSDPRDTVRRMVAAGLINQKLLAPQAAKRASEGGAMAAKRQRRAPKGRNVP
jgi:hypothetical protein